MEPPAAVAVAEPVTRSSTLTPALARVQVVESAPPAPPERRTRWPFVGGVLGLAAGIGLGLAYHDRLPAEPPADAPGDPPPVARVPLVAPAPDLTAVKRIEAELAKLDGESRRLDAEIAERAGDAKAASARLAESRADLDRVRQQLAALDRRPVADPVPPPKPAAADDPEVKALREQKARLGERLGPEHRDMLALDEQIRAAERRAAAARPKAPEPAPGPDRGAVEAERAVLVAQAALLAGAIARDGRTAAESEKPSAELERVADARAELSAKLVEAVTAARPAPAPDAAEPTPPRAAAVKPPAWRSLLPGGLAGLLLGTGLGFLVSLLVSAGREPVMPVARPPAGKPSKEATEDAAFGLPVLARVPQLRTDQPAERRSGEGLDPVLVTFHRPKGAEAEAFRAARRGLAAALHNRGHVVVVVTGPGPGDGKTTVAANLAVSLAQAGKRVILVDCDLRSPGVQGLFKLTRLGDGLRSVMTADTDLRLAVRTCEVGNLFLLPAGRGSMDPVDLLTRPKFRELIADLRAGSEYVVVDGPPATAEAELAALAEHADGVVVAVRAGADAVTRAGWARDQVAAAGAKPIGVVVNVTPATDDAHRQDAGATRGAGADAPRSPEERAAT